MKMSVSNNSISWPLLAALFGATIGALSGQFVWALILTVGASALAFVARNLSAIFRRPNSAEDQTTLVETDDAMSRSIEMGPDWLRKWKEDIYYSPAYKGTPGNIWSGPKWASDD